MAEAAEVVQVRCGGEVATGRLGAERGRVRVWSRCGEVRLCFRFCAEPVERWCGTSLPATPSAATGDRRR